MWLNSKRKEERWPISCLKCKKSVRKLLPKQARAWVRFQCNRGHAGCHYEQPFAEMAGRVLGKAPPRPPTEDTFWAQTLAGAGSGSGGHRISTAKSGSNKSGFKGGEKLRHKPQWGGSSPLGHSATAAPSTARQSPSSSSREKPRWDRQTCTLRCNFPGKKGIFTCTVGPRAAVGWGW